jgi:hypothetical protein
MYEVKKRNFTHYDTPSSETLKFRYCKRLVLYVRPDV